MAAPPVAMPALPLHKPQHVAEGPRPPFVTRKGDISVGWTEHVAPDGRKYYFNAQLNKSTWERPLDEQKAGGGTVSSGTLEWAEYRAPDGRKYFYNAFTKESRWTPPDGYSAKGAASLVPPSGSSSSIRHSHHVVPLGAIQQGPTPHYPTTAEAKSDFLRLLSDAGIPPTLSWEQVSQLVATDRRFGALSTAGDRKAAFNEYVQQKKKQEAEEVMQKRAKASFLLLL